MTDSIKTLEAVEVNRDEEGGFYHPALSHYDSKGNLHTPESLKNLLISDYGLRAEIHHFYIGNDKEEGELSSLHEFHGNSDFQESFLVSLFHDGEEYEGWAVFAYPNSNENMQILINKLADQLSEEIESPYSDRGATSAKLLSVWLELKLKVIKDTAKHDTNTVDIGGEKLTTKEEIHGFKVGLFAATAIVGEPPISIS